MITFQSIRWTEGHPFHEIILIYNHARSIAKINELVRARVYGGIYMIISNFVTT